MTEEINSRSADKFVVRLKPGMRDQLKARAKSDNQSMNAAAVTAIEKYLAQGKAIDALLAVLEREVGNSGKRTPNIDRAREAAKSLNDPG
jgi:hypothetical protein